MIRLSDLAIKGYLHKKAHKKVSEFFLAWYFFLVIVDVLMNSKRKASVAICSYVRYFLAFKLSWTIVVISYELYDGRVTDSFE